MSKESVFIWEQTQLQSLYLQGIYQAAGYQTHSVTGYMELRQALSRKTHQRSLIVISLSPKTNLKQFQFLQRLAPLSSLLVISSDQDLQRCLDCFTAGADAFLTKPLQAEHLVMQSMALLRQVKRIGKHHSLSQTQRQQVFGPLTLDLDQGAMTLEGSESMLSKREFALLHYFCTHAGQILSRERLYDLLWPDQSDTRSRQLDNLVLGLRHKLSDSDRVSIETHYAEGYLFRF